MSLIRDARYNARAAVSCRTDGHRVTGDRCGVCNIREDAADTSPYTPGVRIVGGMPVGRMVADPTAPRTPTRDKCAQGHSEWYVLASGNRKCRPCTIAGQQRRRLSFGRRAAA